MKEAYDVLVYKFDIFYYYFQPLFLYFPHQLVHEPDQVPAEFEQRYSHIKHKARRKHAGMLYCHPSVVRIINFNDVIENQC